MDIYLSADSSLLDFSISLFLFQSLQLACVVEGITSGSGYYGSFLVVKSQLSLS